MDADCIEKISEIGNITRKANSPKNLKTLLNISNPISVFSTHKIINLAL